MTTIKIILLAYLALMTGIGIFSFFRIKTNGDFFVSGKKGSWWSVSGSLFATILGGSAILGTIELSQKAGWAALWFPGSAAIGLFILTGIAPKVSRVGHYTLPEMINLFYGSKAERTATIIIPIAWLGVIAVQIIAGAKTLAGVGLMSYPTGAVTCAGVFILYTLLGGQKSVLKTDFIQALIILSGLTILFALKIKNLHSENIQIPVAGAIFNGNFRLIDLFILLITYSVTFVVGPDIYSRIFCARNERIARKSVLITAFLIIPVAFILTFLGITAASDTPVSGSIPSVIPGTTFLPDWGIGIVAMIMLAAVMSSADTTLLTGGTILSELVTGNLDHRKSLKITRIFIILTGLTALGIAIKVTSILSALMLSFSFYSGAFILPVIAGIAKWKVNRHLAWYAMIAGGVTALSGKIIQEAFHQEWGYALIVSAYVINGAILFFPARHK